MEQRNFRPHLHFAPEHGWLNDPNGLIYHNGIWHMYFQHHPEGLVWGPMHWGHAVSKDLIHWEELSIALRPEDEVWMFSGSMVYDKDNTSGMAKTDAQGNLIPPLAAFYTSHRITDHKESQSVAFSYDGGMTFEKYQGNPVVDTEIRDGKSLHDFRDPKVFRNPDTGLWNMTLAASDRCNFYESSDLLHWTLTGSFAHGYEWISNTWACTDLIPFDTEEGRKWVLFASMENDIRKEQARTMYFAGNFDGKNFVPDERPVKPMWIDFGWDNYAGVSFNDAGFPVMISWGNNPRYANQVPTAESGFRGIMTSARDMKLVKIDSHWKLSFTPHGYDRLFEEAKRKQPAAEGTDHRSAQISECSMMKITGSEGKILLKNDQDEQFEITVSKDRIAIDRTRAGRYDFSDDYARYEFSRRSVKRCRTDIAMTIIYDVCSVEVYAEDGLETASVDVYPLAPYSEIVTEGDLRVESADLQLR